MGRRGKKRDSKRPGRKQTGKRASEPRAQREGNPGAGNRAAAEAAPGPPKLSAGKRLLFHAVTAVVFFALLELVLALFGVRPVLVEEDPYVGFSSQIRLYQPAGSGELRTAANKLSLFNPQTFAARKQRGSFRIFTLGGSSTYGRPFADPTSFSGWLRSYLPAVDSSRTWEVINAGGISYASYRVATLMEELVEYDPDLFIIYSGHNEFLERRTYSGLIEEPVALTRTKLLLQRSRLWTVGRNLVERRRKQARERYQLTGEVDELLDTSVGLDYYFRDRPFERQVLDHYRFNLQRMVSLARAGGAQVILVSIPVNEKDMSPFKSQYSDGIGEAERDRHRALLAAASEALASRPEEARELAGQALELDPLYADGHFLHGRALLALGHYDQADAAFGRAIEEDVCPLRALPEINQLIADAARRTGVPLVDFRGLLEQRMLATSGHTILGDELFLDHAHPTVEAHGILARALVETMDQMGIVKLAPGGLESVDHRVEAEVSARLDAESQARAYKNLSKLLIWTGKKKEAEKYVRLATEVLGDDWELHYNAGIVHLEARRLEAAIESFTEAVRLGPERAPAHDQLGLAYAAAGRVREAIAAGRRAVEIDPRLAEAWNNLGTFLGAAGDLDEARSATRQALRLQPDNAEAHNNLGKVLFDQGEFEAALASYERAARLRPNYAEAMANRGLVLGEMGRFEEAVEAFSAALELDSRLVSAHLGKGQALLGQGTAAAAITSFETVIKLDPHSVDAYEALTMSLLAAGQTERSWEVLKEGLDNNRDNPQAARLYRLYGRFLAQEGTYEAAARSFARALELDPDLLAARVDLGNLHMVRGRRGDAIRTYREALERHGSDDGLHHILATALLIDGQLDAGRRHLERALELNPDNARAAQDLAKVYEQLGRLDEARELTGRASAPGGR